MPVRKFSTARPSEDYPGSYDLFGSTGKLVAVIDADIVESAIQHCWRRSGGYAVRNVTPKDHRQTLDTLQRFVARAKGHDLRSANVTFVNKDSRDCRLENLKVVSVNAPKRVLVF